MITPTGVTAAEYWAAIKAGRPTHVRLTFIGQDIVLDDRDISYNSGVNVTDVLNGETDLVFGRAVSKQVTMGIINSNRVTGLKWTGEFTLEFGVDIGSPATTYWVQIGIFSGEKPENITSAEIIDFTAYDRMMRFNAVVDEYARNITYPATVQDIYDGLCSHIGIENTAGDELANIMAREYSAAPAEIQGYTCRDLLAWIAEACGCYARINAAGQVQMVWFTDNTSHVVTGDEEFRVQSGDVNDGMTWDEAEELTWDEIDQLTWDDVCGYEETYSIDQLLVRQLNTDVAINYPYATDGNIYLISGNPFLSVSTYSDITEYIAPLYDRMKAFGGYLPVKLESVGNWCVEAGDIITIDVNENTITFPIFMKTMRWNGAVRDAYETTGNKSRVLYTSDVEKQQVLMAKKIEMFVEEAADGIAEEVQQNVESEMEQNYYKIRSGIAIEAAGVTVSGGKYVNIESGSKIDVKSGADIDVESGGDINVKSGGNLNVASGGNIDIKGSGTLQLTGSSVSVTSGSTFDVQATNFEINSATQTFRAGLFWIDTSGFHYLKQNVGKCDMFFGVDPVFGTGNWFKFIADGIDLLLTSLKGDTQVHGKKIRFTGLCIRDYNDCEFGEITMEHDEDDDFTRILFNPRTSGYYGGIGASYNRWRQGYFYSLYYVNIYSNSSRDIKHDIVPMESVGDKLDKLEPVTFVYDDDEEENKRMGLIYEDTVEVMPEICTEDENNKAIDYLSLVPALLKEIQDLRSRVKALEERIGD